MGKYIVLVGIFVLVFVCACSALIGQFNIWGG